MLRYFYFKYTLLIWFSLSFNLISQNDSSYLYIDNIFLNEVVLTSDHTDFNAKDFFLLKRRVLKVYPYVDTIVQIMSETDSILNTINKKRLSNKYSRRIQKELINQFSQKITQLSRKEGLILSKLLYRQFQYSAYELIKKYRGPFQAFFWQKISRIYDGNLKSEYSPYTNQEDIYIELIINKYIDQ
ncbi:MAG: hypothetical protein CMD26_05265 [Flavobacteriales bacterium]|nr:hypothetical protein [Flavobacteriales bacterium]|tara:strand:+ start:10398 stop:10955 length:558 start_codon:yes stop_codon:yes gene_type:complete